MNAGMNSAMNANNYQNRHNNNGHQGNRGGGRRNPGMLNRSLESNGPEGKVRGTALQLYERYKALAREHQASDRVLAENFGQFADHYYRLAAEYGAFDTDSQQRADGQQDRAVRPGDGQSDSAVDLPAEDALIETGVQTEAGAEQEPAPRAELQPEAMPDIGNEPVTPDTPRRHVNQDVPNLADGVLRTLGAPLKAAPAQQPSLLDGMVPSPAAEDVAEKVETADVDATEAPQKRRRGRPRKTAVEAEGTTAAPDTDAAAANAAETPSRRGRPRKTPEAASA
jgi:hypothetical protein